MGYLLNEDQQAIVSSVKDFMEKEVAPICAECDRTGELPMAAYDMALEMGLHSMEIPEEFGGGGVDYMTVAAACEEMGKVDAGFATTMGATGLAIKPVLLAGTDAQKQMYADILGQKKFAAFCLTEPMAGSDAGACAATAVRDGDEYIINGSKCFITNGGIADVYVVFASVDRSKGLKGLTAFIVERNRPGVSTGKEEDKFGIRLSNTCDVIFEDVRVPASNRLGEEGEGFKIAMRTLDLSRPFIGAIAVGISQRALDEAVAYSKTRVTFGKPIAKQQALQFMMADMDMQTEAARQTVIYCINRITAGLPYSREAAICKCFAGDTAVKSALDAIQILGGYGYSREYPVEKLLRDAKIFQIFEGTNQIQRVVIAGQLLK